MRFYPDFRDSNSRRLTVALLFSLVLHALFLVFVRFAQPDWKNSSYVTTLNVILEKTVAEVAQPAGIPQARLQSKGKARIGVQAATPAAREKAPATITPAKNEQHKAEPPKVDIEKRILTQEAPAKFIVPESAAEVQVTQSLPPEETAKPVAPAPSVENPIAKPAPAVEETKKIVTVEAAQEKPAVEKPLSTINEPAKIEEPKPVKVEEPKPVIEEAKPVKVEEPKPVRIEEPKPVMVEEPKPVKLEEPKPVKFEEPKPVKLEESKPVKVETPQPVRIEEAKPVKPEVAAAPQASPVEGGKLEGTQIRPPSYAMRNQFDLGMGGVRSLPRIAERRMVFGERRKIISSKEQELRYIMYRDSVLLKLHRIGQLNYPGSMGGTLVVQISIRPDGSLEGISIVQPSPHETLNAGAEKIIKMCAPFSPLPENIRQDTDILTIRINWNFENSRQTLD